MKRNRRSSSLLVAGSAFFLLDACSKKTPLLADASPTPARLTSTTAPSTVGSSPLLVGEHRTKYVNETFIKHVAGETPLLTSTQFVRRGAPAVAYTAPRSEEGEEEQGLAVTSLPPGWPVTLVASPPPSYRRFVLVTWKMTAADPAAWLGWVERADLSNRQETNPAAVKKCPAQQGWNQTMRRCVPVCKTDAQCGDVNQKCYEDDTPYPDAWAEWPNEPVAICNVIERPVPDGGSLNIRYPVMLPRRGTCPAPGRQAVVDAVSGRVVCLRTCATSHDCETEDAWDTTHGAAVHLQDRCRPMLLPSRTATTNVCGH